jgi:hypothetical protein
MKARATNHFNTTSNQAPNLWPMGRQACELMFVGDNKEATQCPSEGVQGPSDGANDRGPQVNQTDTIDVSGDAREPIGMQKTINDGLGTLVGMRFRSAFKRSSTAKYTKDFQCSMKMWQLPTLLANHAANRKPKATIS